MKLTNMRQNGAARKALAERGERAEAEFRIEDFPEG
jgi:hypothetical protein